VRACESAVALAADAGHPVSEDRAPTGRTANPDGVTVAKEGQGARRIVGVDEGQERTSGNDDGRRRAVPNKK